MAINIMPGLIDQIPQGLSFQYPQAAPSFVGASNVWPQAAYSGALTPGALPSIGSAASSALPYADVAATGGQSLMGGLASRLPSLGGLGGIGAGAEGYTAPLAGVGARLGTGLLSKAVVPAIGIGGDMALDRLSKALVGKQHNSLWSDVGEGAGGGALAGGAAGAFGLPIPLVGEVTTAGGAALGALIGGGAGLLGHLFGGKKSAGPNIDNTINSAIAASGIDAQRAAELQTYYTVLTKLGGGGDKAKQAAASQVGQMLVQQMGQSQQQQLTDPQYIASIQAQTANFVRPFAEQAMSNAGQYAKAVSSFLPGLPAAYQDVLRAGITDQLGASLQLANAYAAQAQMAPQAYAYQQQQNQLNQVAQQVLSQGIGSALGNGSGGGSLTSLLQQPTG